MDLVHFTIAGLPHPFYVKGGVCLCIHCTHYSIFKIDPEWSSAYVKQERKT